MGKPLIIANWKSNPDTLSRAAVLARKIERGLARSLFRHIDIVIAPPFPFLSRVGQVLKSISLGAQNVFWENTGPYTGEVSWHQLKHLGVRYVIVGHSERKIYLGETDEMINKKIRALLSNKLKAVLCVGEGERPGAEIPEIVGDQLKQALAGVKKSEIGNLIVCYEPVWAISTRPGARADTPDNAWRALVFIRRILTDLYGRDSADSIRIIYGGSVNSKNIESFLREGKMEGALVGGASLNFKEFAEIVKNAARGRI